MRKIDITLTQAAYYCGGDYRTHTDEGRPAVYVLHGFYMASATDTDGNGYTVYWGILPDYNPDIMDEDAACNWDDPDEVVSDSGEIVTTNVSIKW